MGRLAWMLALCVAAAATAQQQNQPGVDDVASQAGIIFRGQVVAVQVKGGRAPDEITETRVTFRVEDAVRGVAQGQMLTICEWKSVAEEYRIGESLVLFLHAPSAQLGLSSPVGGRAGHRRVDEVPRAMLDALRATPEPEIVPVRSTAPLPRAPRVRTRRNMPREIEE